MKTFEAKYSSRCPDCSVPIEPGDEVIYVGDLVAHVGCTEAAEQRASSEVAGSTCTSCWEVRSVSGNCSCDLK